MKAGPYPGLGIEQELGLYCILERRQGHPSTAHVNRMNPEKIITEIECLERLYSLPDPRPLQLSDFYAANQRHDETYANNPWFRLWKRYGI